MDRSNAMELGWPVLTATVMAGAYAVALSHGFSPAWAGLDASWVGLSLAVIALLFDRLGGYSFHNQAWVALTGNMYAVSLLSAASLSHFLPWWGSMLAFAGAAVVCLIFWGTILEMFEDGTHEMYDESIARVMVTPLGILLAFGVDKLFASRAWAILVLAAFVSIQAAWALWNSHGHYLHRLRAQT